MTLKEFWKSFFNNEAKVNVKNKSNSLIYIIIGVLFIFYILISNSSKDKKNTKQPVQTNNIQPAVNATPTVKKKTNAEFLMEAESISSVDIYTNIICRDSETIASFGSFALCRASMIAAYIDRQMLSKYLSTQKDHSYSEVMREGDDAFGWKYCSSGTVFDFRKIPAGQVKNSPVYSGAIIRGDFKIIRFMTNKPYNTDDYVSLCGILAGIYEYSNTGGGTTIAPIIYIP